MVHRRTAERGPVMMRDNEALRYLTYNWGDIYAFARPACDNDQWTAAARSGNQEVITTPTSGALIAEVGKHHPRNPPRRPSAST
jgi:hypothetical protein